MKPYLSEEMILSLKEEESPENDRKDAYRQIQLIDLVMRSWLKDAQVKPDELLDKTRAEVSQILGDFFERFSEYVVLRKRILGQVQMTLLRWHEGLSLEKAICALQRAVERDPMKASEPDAATEYVNGAFMGEIFDRFDDSREIFGWPEASHFPLHKNNVLLLVDHGILTLEDLEKLVMIHTMMTPDAALSEPAPLSRRIRTLYSLYRAMEDGVFDEELRPAFQEIRRLQPELASDEDARGIFVGCARTLLAEISEGEDIASGLELVTVMARLSAQGSRRLQQEKDGHFEPGTVSNGEILVYRFLLPILERIRKHMQVSRLEDERFIQRLLTAPLAETMLEDILGESEPDQGAEGKVA